MKCYFLYFAVAVNALAYVDGTALFGDVGAKTITVTDSGPIGGTQSVVIPVGASQRFKAWFSIPGYKQHHWVTALTTGNTGVSGCTSVTASWPNSGAATATLTSGAVSGWTITNPGDDYSSTPTVTITFAGCAQTPTATATVLADTTCSAPCTLSINTEYGQVSYWYEITDSSGNSLSPRVLSSQLFLTFTEAACETSPFTVGKPVLGFHNYTTCVQFSIAGGVSVSNLRLYLATVNLRPGLAAVSFNLGPYILIRTTAITSTICNGSRCDFVTSALPPGEAFTSGETIDLNMFNIGTYGQGSTVMTGGAQLNGLQTILASPAPTTNTFSISSSVPSGIYVVSNTGQTVGINVQYCGERRYFGGLDGDRQFLELCIVIPNGVMTAGATNRIDFRYTDDPAYDYQRGAHGYWLESWNVIQPDFEMDGIVVSSTTATAHTTSAHPYSANDTLILRDAPGPRWRFCGRHVITSSSDNTHFAFNWGSDLAGETPGVAPYLTTNATYTIPTTIDSTMQPQPHMYAARALIPEANFQYYNPATQTTYGGNASNGQTIWQSGTMKDLNPFLPNNASISPGCAGCHDYSGTDLRIHGFNEYDSLITSLRRGLSESNAKDVASFITSNVNPVPPKGRPWNSPFQPAVGLDSGTVIYWRAGGGVEWLLTYDGDTCEYMLPGCLSQDTTTIDYSKWAVGGNGSSVGVNLRETPVYLQMPTFFNWLPIYYPGDVFAQFKVGGGPFASNGMQTGYTTYRTGLVPRVLSLPGISAGATTISLPSSFACTNNDIAQIDGIAGESLEYVTVTAGCGTTSLTVTRGSCPQAGCPAATSHSSGTWISDYTSYANFTFLSQVGLFASANSTFEASYQTKDIFPPAYANPGNPYLEAIRSTRDWLDSHALELVTNFGLMNMLDQSRRANNGAINAAAATPYSRGFDSVIFRPFNRGPHQFIGGGSNPSGKYYISNGYVEPRNWNGESAIWYHEAAILDAGDRLDQGNFQLDPGYYLAFNQNLGGYRGGLWMSTMQSMFGMQEGWGWSDANIGAGNPSMAGIVGTGQAFRNIDLLTPEAAKTGVMTAVANTMWSAFNSGRLTTTQWQSALLTASGCSGQPWQAPSSINPLAGICIQNAFSFFLPIANYYSVSTTLLNNIANWLDNHIGFNSGGIGNSHHYINDVTSAPCHFITPGGNPPRALSCPLFTDY